MAFKKTKQKTKNKKKPSQSAKNDKLAAKKSTSRGKLKGG